MGNCIKRHVRNQARMGGWFLLGMLLAVVFLALMALFTNDFSDMGELPYIVYGETVTALLFCSMICAVTDKVTYSRTYMTFPCSRRAAFWGNQLFKLLYTLVLIIAIFGTCVLLDVFCGGALLQTLGLPMFLILWVGAAALYSMGELIGDLTLRFGKWGFIMYVALCAVMGGVIGFLAVAAGRDGFQGMLQATMQTPAWMIVPLLGVAVLFSLLSYLLWRRTTIKA